MPPVPTVTWSEFQIAEREREKKRTLFTFRWFCDKYQNFHTNRITHRCNNIYITCKKITNNLYHFGKKSSAAYLVSAYEHYPALLDFVDRLFRTEMVLMVVMHAANTFPYSLHQFFQNNWWVNTKKKRLTCDFRVS